MDYLSIRWESFLENKWVSLNGIVLSNAQICSTTLSAYELMEKPFEVLIAILLPLRNTHLLQQISLGLDENFVTLAKPSLKVGYKIKLNSECVKVALINWGDYQECGGIITWIGDADVTFIDSVGIQEKLSDLHNYCHSRQQQMDLLHNEAAENAIALGNAFADMNNIIPMDSSIFLSEIDTPQGDTNPTVNNSSTIETNTNSEFKLIKSSRRRDKLSYDGYIYNFQRTTNVAKHWRCQFKNCKGRIHTVGTSILKMIGQHCHAEEIGKEEVLEFRNRVKIRALESHDNPHRIIAEASGELTEMAKTLLPCEKSLKKLCQRVRPMPANPTSLFDLHIDSNLKSLGGNNFLLFDTGPGIDRMIIFGTEENKKILSFASIWMADGTFKVVPSLFAQL